MVSSRVPRDLVVALVLLARTISKRPTLPSLLPIPIMGLHILPLPLRPPTPSSRRDLSAALSETMRSCSIPRTGIPTKAVLRTSPASYLAFAFRRTVTGDVPPGGVPFSAEVVLEAFPVAVPEFDGAEDLHSREH